MFDNYVHITGRQAQSLTVSGSADTTAMLEAGSYAVWSDTEIVSISVSPDRDKALEVTTTNGMPIPGDGITKLPVLIKEPAYIGAIATGTGNLYYMKVS